MDFNQNARPSLPPKLAEINEKLNAADSVAEIYATLVTDFDALSPEEKGAILNDGFPELIDGIQNCDAELLQEFYAALSLAEHSPSDMHSIYPTTEMFAAAAEQAGDSPLAEALKNRIGSLSDAEYENPHLLTSAFKKAICDVLPSDLTEGTPEIKIIRNPFKPATAETPPENAEKPVNKSAALRNFLRRRS